MWGGFSTEVQKFRASLFAAPADEPTMQVQRRCVVAFNDYGADGVPGPVRPASRHVHPESGPGAVR
ncbi:hypothetical protein AB0L40_07890 [Patulibacter sp. NPDC049589]|uniref:hypothetical protein n=1 Tax=Patulibacter sp. NPDC049589 TaxID=3154731 RepID=UPI003414C995